MIPPSGAVLLVEQQHGSPVIRLHKTQDEVLELRDIEKPTIGDHDVLVRVRAAAVNPGDWAIMSGLPYIARPAPLVRAARAKESCSRSGRRRASCSRRRRRDAVSARWRG